MALPRERTRGQNSRLNPLRMDITTEAEALFDNHPRLTNKALLLDITIGNPCAASNLGNAARHVGKPRRRSQLVVEDTWPFRERELADKTAD